jgi:hypothetical protein
VAFSLSHTQKIIFLSLRPPGILPPDGWIRWVPPTGSSGTFSVLWFCQLHLICNCQFCRRCRWWSPTSRSCHRRAGSVGKLVFKF